MSLKAEKDRLIGHQISREIYSSYSRESSKSIVMKVGIISKDVTYVVTDNSREVLRVSDLDIAIDKFNQLD